MGSEEPPETLLNWRNITAVIAVVVLIVLLVWQHERERLVHNCGDLGGVWNGATSSCDFRPGRILMRPNFQRG